MAALTAKDAKYGFGRLIDPARFPWHEATKVPHYWLEVDAMPKPMGLREEQAPYRQKEE